MKTSRLVSGLPISYIGSKWHLAPLIVSYMPQHEKYLEVFGGSAAVLLRKERSEIEIYNDRFCQVVNLLLVIKNHLNELLDWLANIPFSRKLQSVYIKDVAKLIPDENLGKDVESAGKFYYTNVLSFVGGCTFLPTTVRQNKIRNFKILKEVSIRLKNVNFEYLDFRECLKRYDSKDLLVYSDPPYWGLNYYEVKFGEKDHKEHFELLKKLNCKWIISYNACDEVLELYKDFVLVKVEWKACAPNINRETNVMYKKVYYELLIMNYKPDNLKNSDKIVIVNDKVKGDE